MLALCFDTINFLNNDAIILFRSRQLSYLGYAEALVSEGPSGNMKQGLSIFGSHDPSLF